MKILAKIALERIFRQPLPRLDSMSLNAYRSAASFRSTSEIEQALAAQHLKNDPVYITAQLNEGKITLDHVDQKLIENVEIRQRGLQIDGLGLQLIPTHLQTSNDVLMAVQSNGLALQFAKPEFTSDKDILRTAVKENGLALEFVDKSLIKDDPELYFEIVSIAVKENGLALEFTTPDLKNNIEIVELAYNQDPESLQFASHRLKKVFNQRHEDQENANELLSLGFHNKEHSNISNFIKSMPVENYTNKELFYHAMVKPLFDIDKDDLDWDEVFRLDNDTHAKLREILEKNIETTWVYTPHLLEAYHNLYKHSDVPVDNSRNNSFEYLPKKSFF